MTPVKIHDPEDQMRRNHEEQMKETAEKAQKVEVAVARINGSVEKLSGRVDDLSTRVSELRVDIRTQHDDHTIAFRELRDAVAANGNRLETYLTECREYRIGRSREELERDEALGIKIHHLEPEGDGLGLLGSVAFAFRQPWFWAILIGMMLGVGGIDGVRWLFSIIFHQQGPG